MIDAKTETSPDIQNVKCEQRLPNISLEIVADSYTIEDDYDVDPVNTVTENDVHTDIQTDIIDKAKGFKTKDKFKRINLMDRNNWKRIDLTEEQAVQVNMYFCICLDSSCVFADAAWAKRSQH